MKHRQEVRINGMDPETEEGYSRVLILFTNTPSDGDIDTLEKEVCDLVDKAGYPNVFNISHLDR